MKTFLFLLCLWMASQGSSALDWNLSVKKSGSIIYACTEDTVIFPYLFNLSESESIVSMTWSYYGNDVTKSISTFFLNDFMTTRHYFDKVTLNKNGNYTMQNVGIQDTGKYVLKIQTQNRDQSKKIYSKEFSLFVSKKLMYKKNIMVAKLSNKAGWNYDTKSFTLSLTCGNFIFKNDKAPIDVEWVTPDGSVKNSTKYNDGKFYLQLDNPVEGGQYVCKIPEKSLSNVCATSNDNTQVTVNVNEDKTRIILLENNIKKLIEQDTKFKEQNTKLKEQGTKLKEQNAQLIKQNVIFKQEISELQKLTINSCEDLYSSGSGIRTIYLTLSQSVKIYCDQDTDGGRWNVIQRRQDGSVNFRRNWLDYRNGFGDLDGEFWLGLETLHQMTNDGRKYELRFRLVIPSGSVYYAAYDDFSIDSESEGYAVHFTAYSSYRGDAGDSFSNQVNSKFSTYDRDNEESGTRNCGKEFPGGWWYAYPICVESNLNGQYDSNEWAQGVVWKKLTDYGQSLKESEMKFRVKH